MRILLDFLLLLLIFIMPAYVAMVIAICFFFLFENYFELIIGAFILDLLYGGPVSRLGDFQFVYTLGGLAIYLILAGIKRRLRLSQ